MTAAGSIVQSEKLSLKPSSSVRPHLWCLRLSCSTSFQVSTIYKCAWGILGEAHALPFQRSGEWQFKATVATAVPSDKIGLVGHSQHLALINAVHTNLLQDLSLLHCAQVSWLSNFNPIAYWHLLTLQICSWFFSQTPPETPRSVQCGTLPSPQVLHNVPRYLVIQIGSWEWISTCTSIL